VSETLNSAHRSSETGAICATNQAETKSSSMVKNDKVKRET